MNCKPVGSMTIKIHRNWLCFASYFYCVVYKEIPNLRSAWSNFNTQSYHIMRHFTYSSLLEQIKWNLKTKKSVLVNIFTSTLLPTLYFPYIYNFLHYLNLKMLVNVKLDVSWYKGLPFNVGYFIDLFKFWMERSRQYWHSCTVERSWWASWMHKMCFFRFQFQVMLDEMNLR